MTELEEKQRKNRFYFYLILLVACIVISFYSGFKWGRELENDHWIKAIREKKDQNSLRLMF
jgi:hypothetical protein